MTKVFIPNRQRLIERGYRSIAHVPVLFGGDGRYLRDVNNYLRDRATLKWPPPKSAVLQIAIGRKPTYPCQETLKKIAYSLVNALGWINKNRYDWRTIEYDPHVIRYGDDQASGKWSHGKVPAPLATSTIEPRVDSLSDFLGWGAHHGLRAAFEIPKVQLKRNFATGASSRPTAKMVEVRAGRRRQDPVNLRLPELSELKSWVRRVEEQQGYVKALVCRTIIATGMRREEASQLPIDFVPKKRADWDIRSGRVRFRLTKGTKGGRTRFVSMPLSLAEEIHQYRLDQRVKNLAKWIKRNPGRSRSEYPGQLFLGDYAGDPVSGQTIWRAWSTAPIFSGWSPHAGRHTWACYTLLDILRNEAARAGLTVGSIPVTWLDSTTKTLIALYVQPQLGHIDEQTTRIYVQWLHAQCSLPSVYDEWHSWLEGGEDDAGA